MTISDLTQLIQQVVKEQLRATQQPQPIDPDKLRAVMAWIDRHRWKPPLRAPSVVEMLSAQQTEAGISAQVKAAAAESKVCRNRVDFYLGHLSCYQSYVPSQVNHVCRCRQFLQQTQMGG